MTIDLNADVGEGYDDRGLIPFVSSVNVACGGHTGDERTMARAVDAALRQGVAVGAHPSYPDRPGFGRREISITTGHLEATVREQVLALSRVASKQGAKLTHVKPHGALYNRAAADHAVARVVALAVRSVDPSLRLVGLAGSVLLEVADEAGLVSVAEGFVDRGYAPDGSLVARGLPGALLLDPCAVVAQAVGIARDGVVIARDGTPIRLHAQTLCLHGDTRRAAEIARVVRAGLDAAEIAVAAPH